MLDRLKSPAWILLAAIFGPQLAGCRPAPVELGKAEYRDQFASPECKPGLRVGKAGITNNETTPAGIRFNVRTPVNYNPSYLHPLIVVYAPAGRNRFGSEALTNLTYAATSAGFVIAYPDHKRMSGKALMEMAGIPEQIAAKWCIDNSTIYLTGHSDGGTIAMGLAFLEDTRHIPDAIAPSAAGIRGSDLMAYPCPEPISVLILHSKNDRLFPEFGKESAKWWAACNQCGTEPQRMQVAGCFEYPDCRSNVKTWYCEGKAPHGEWPDLNSTIIGFFAGEAARTRSTIGPPGSAKESF
ncbi:MAG: poly(3-hydroxybutyrate) depolymerase [Gammaproteobacteria bacterium]